MGLFDGLKIMGDVVGGIIESTKVGLKLDELVDKSITDFDSKRNEENKKLYNEYILLKDKKDKEKDQEKANQMVEEVEMAEIAYLTSLTQNKSLPAEFISEITVAMIDYKKSSNAAIDRVKARMLKMAKTDAERKEIEEMWK